MGGIQIQLFTQVRTRLGFTQKEMAQVLSITPRQYGRIERGESKTSKKTWMLFCMFALMIIPGATIAIPEEDDGDPEWL